MNLRLYLLPPWLHADVYPLEKNRRRQCLILPPFYLLTKIIVTRIYLVTNGYLSDCTFLYFTTFCAYSD